MSTDDTQNSSQIQSINASLSAIRESFGRVAYSHKTHEKAADRLNRNIARLKWTNLTLVVLTFSGVLGVVFTDDQWLNVATVVVSGFALGASIYQLSFSPGQEVLEHRKAANKLWLIREEFINLIADIKDSELSGSEVRRRRDDLTQRLGDVYADAASTRSQDYLSAQRALTQDEELTFSVSEIDNLLPDRLREHNEKNSGGNT